MVITGAPPQAVIATAGREPGAVRAARVTVIGAGAFGTAVAATLARRGHGVTLCCRTPDQAAAINAESENRAYFPGRALPRGLSAAHDPAACLEADAVFLAFPAQRMDEYVALFAGRMAPGTVAINLVKGLHEESFTFARLFAERLPGIRYAALKGPTFAGQMLDEQWSGLTCGTASGTAWRLVQDLFRGAPVDLDHHESAEAVDAVSAIKNVYAVALGLVAATRPAENTTFLLISRAVKEIGAVLARLGHDPGVLHRHCGLGDVLMTGLCATSRNRTLGVMLGEGHAVDPLRAGFLAEGARAVGTLHRRAGGPDTPLLGAVRDILAGEAAPASILGVLGR